MRSPLERPPSLFRRGAVGMGGDGRGEGNSGGGGATRSASVCVTLDMTGLTDSTLVLSAEPICAALFVTKVPAAALTAASADVSAAGTVM